MDIRFKELTRKKDRCKQAVLTRNEVKAIVKDPTEKHRKKNRPSAIENRKGTSDHVTTEKGNETESTNTRIEHLSNGSERKGWGRRDRHCKRSERNTTMTSSNSTLNESSPETKTTDPVESTRNKKSHKGKPKVLTPLSSRFDKEIDYRTYRLRDRNPRFHNKQVGRLAKLAKRIKAHMSTMYFNGKYLVLILGFLDSYKISCD